MNTSNATMPNVKISTTTATFVPLSDLFVSPNNVRKVAPSGIEELAASIESQGLLHALHVTAETINSVPTGRFAVEAGGRRLVALQLLLSRGRVDASLAIECRVIDEKQALEISLTENISQESMHPADEFEAYQLLVSQGRSIESISTKFGVTVIHVQRRLKMANVAPELVALYRANEITLDHIMAFATITDHERQLLAWKGLGTYNRSANNLKRLLTENEVAVTDYRVTFIGLDAYVAAGGSLRTDLFSTEQTAYLTNPQLLDSLVAERLKKLSDTAVSQGWAWVDVLPNFGYQTRQDFILPGKTYLPETPENEADRLQLEAELEALNADSEVAHDEEDWDLVEKLEVQMSAINQKIDSLQELRITSEDFDKTISGVVICLERDGLLNIEGVFRKSDKKKIPVDASGQNANAQSSRAEVPEKLMMNLSSHRTAAIQASMLKNPDVALAALANKMALAVFHHYVASPVKINLTLSRSALERNAPTLSDSKAAAEMDTAQTNWTNRLPANSNDWLSWFLSEPQATSVEMIVFATAHSTDAVQSSLTNADAAKTLANSLSLDMADWWTATPETYFDLVPKAKLIEAVTEISGEKVAGEMLKMKKVEAIAYTTQHLKGKRWLPIALRQVNDVPANS